MIFNFQDVDDVILKKKLGKKTHNFINEIK